MLDFNHAYTAYCMPDYFISFGDGSIIRNWPGGGKESFLKRDALVIKEVSRVFNASNSLKLLEYGIKNIGFIKANQKTIVYEENYYQWRIKTIDLAISRRIASLGQSEVIDGVMRMKIFKAPDKNLTENSLTYYFQNNTFHLAGFSKKGIECPLALRKIYQFIVLPSNEAIVFDTDTNFYYIRANLSVFCSKKYTINNTQGYYQPYGYKTKKENTITLAYWFYDKNLGRIEKEVFYKTDTDELIQDN